MSNNQKGKIMSRTWIMSKLPVVHSGSTEEAELLITLWERIDFYLSEWTESTQQKEGGSTSAVTGQRMVNGVRFG